MWHYYWKSDRSAIGNRGMGMYGGWLYFETPDNHVVSLDAATGAERWHKQIASVRQQYFSTPAPVVIRNHVIVGMGGDALDVPAWLESRDPETGDIQWKWYTTPRRGEPGIETWPNEQTAANGGGMPWQPPTYDPELNLLYVPTGNPNPVLDGRRRPGANLYTASIVALDVDTGKMAWHFQGSPHDTHDWDGTQVPVLFDADDRRQAAQAAGAGESQRLLLRPRPHQRPDHRVEAVHRDRQLVRGRRRRRASRFRRPRRSRRFPACWSRRAPTAPPTIRRPASTPTPGSSTSTPPNRGASTT